MKPRAVIFDVDGTLLDSVDFHARAWKRSFEQFNISVDFNEVRSQIGKGGDKLLPVFLERRQIREFGEALEEFRANLFRSEYRGRVRPFHHAHELCTAVHHQVGHIALASSSKREDLEYYIDLLGIGGCLTASTSQADAERSKPDPDIIQAALDRLPGIAPAEGIMVGDSPFDAVAASKLGMKTVGLLCGGFSATELRRAGCVALYDSPSALLTALNDSPLLAG